MTCRKAWSTQPLAVLINWTSLGSDCPYLMARYWKAGYASLFGMGRALDLVGRTLDFDAAYKQSRAIYTKGVRLFGLVWSNYYDDYPQLDVMASGGNARSAAERLFAMLGWRVSMKDTKRRSMAKCFDALGISNGVVQVRNKRTRILQICSEIDCVLNDGNLPISVATSLKASYNPYFWQGACLACTTVQPQGLWANNS